MDIFPVVLLFFAKVNEPNPFHHGTVQHLLLFVCAIIDINKGSWMGLGT